MKKKLIFRALLGAPVGLTISTVITIIISLCIDDGKFYATPPELVDLIGNEVNAMLVQTVCSFLFGAAFAAASVIWEIERWSMLKQTLIHFAAISVSSFPIAFFMYWIPHNVYGALGYVGIFVGIYAIIWVAVFFSAKAKLKKLNEKLDSENKPE